MNKSVPKIRVAVIYGGRSGEHEVSLRSAAAVIKNLDPERFEAVPIGIDKQGHWLLGDMQHLEFEGKALKLPHAESQFMLPPHPRSEARAYSPSLPQGFDVVFPVLHGTNGEDGTVQGLLELAELAYVGPGVLGSAIGMDKDVAKRLALGAGVMIPPYVAVRIGEWCAKKAHIMQLVTEQIAYPVFVKPANAGSSLGISKVKCSEDLAAAVDMAFLYDTKVLIEKGVNAREIELAVLESSELGEEPLVSLPGEVIPHHEFYSYEAKYMDPNGAGLAVPASLSAEELSKAQTMAKRLFVALELEGMARVDLFLDKDSGEFYFNEVNTIPGFTEISLYPQLWQASGLSYTALLSKLIDLAIARQQRRKLLKREKAA